MCLEVALKEEAGLIRQQRFGMRGGLTPGQRYRLDGTSQRPARVGPACRDKRGTEAGHKRHLRANQTPCRECVAGAARERSDRSRDRDAKILELADQGMTQVEIARQLKIARATVNRLIGRSKAAS
jgi:ATP/maltotriose-dependent transcriptional regulator MalT